ncbi:SPASM domain-containing protein [Vulcanisaeta distributa]|uniref:SPASM domain-containing protein n=1 Tax=Vulcanisaeta distributa TaxID=164451 RepID=UPI001FB2AD0A|nr:SPASM domain-containing protein [Vulcanisaeta distributa]
MIFGNINNEGIIGIWNSKDYRDFRSKFIRRRSQGLTVNYNIDLMPPSQCITCYRLYGI